MTNEEAVTEARRLEAMVELRIVSGEIPARPAGHAAWSLWYEEHVRCVEPAHRYFVREKGSQYCATCQGKLLLSRERVKVIPFTLAPKVDPGHTGFVSEVIEYSPMEVPRQARTPRKLR